MSRKIVASKKIVAEDAAAEAEDTAAEKAAPQPIQIIMQYNPLTDPPPAPGTHFNKISVEDAAKKLIGWFRSTGRIPATWEEKDSCENPINAFEMNFWVAAEAGVTMQAARDVVGEMAPELYADYWMERWPPPGKIDGSRDAMERTK